MGTDHHLKKAVAARECFALKKKDCSVGLEIGEGMLKHRGWMKIGTTDEH